MEAALSTPDQLAVAEAMRVAAEDSRRLAEQDRRIESHVARDESRLRRFIRRRVGDDRDAEEILQDVFYELVSAYRLMKPIEETTAWLFAVARNRIIDFGRKKKATPFADLAATDEEGGAASFEDLLPSPDAGPDAQYARSVLLEELGEAIDELPEPERQAFVAHQVEGRSFKELAAEAGVTVNTMILRKHRAVEHLRKQLAAIRAEFVNTKSENTKFGPEEPRGGKI